MVQSDKFASDAWQIKIEIDSRLFDQLICTDPDRVRSMHEELVMLSKEVHIFSKLVIFSKK